MRILSKPLFREKKNRPASLYRETGLPQANEIPLRTTNSDKPQQQEQERAKDLEKGLSRFLVFLFFVNSP
jgi:hypothetical protein